MTLLCPYRNILGAPGVGVHAPRLFGLARNDLLATLAAAVVLTWLASPWASRATPVLKVLLVFAGLWALGWVAHMLFCVRTPLTAPFLGE
jgi:hypothetical protein